MIFVLLLLIGAAVFGVHQLTRRFGFRQLEYQLHFDRDEATEGDTVLLTETVCSRKLLPLPWVKAELTTDAALEFAAEQSAVSEETRFVSSYFCLFPYRQIERRWRVTCTRRGEFSVSRAVLVITDLFGTLELSQPFPEAVARLTVLPAVRAAERPDWMPQYLSGEMLRRRNLIPDRLAFCGIRPYSEGDPLRDLCISATERFDAPMLRQFQETASPALTILLDPETRITDRDTVSDLNSYENAIRLCAACFGEAASMQLPVRFCTSAAAGEYAVDTGFHNARTELHSLLRLLAALSKRITCRFSRFAAEIMRQTDREGTFLIITPLLNADLLQLAARCPNLTIFSLRRLRPAEQLDNIRFIPMKE